MPVYLFTLARELFFVGFLFYSTFILALKSKFSSRAHARAVDVVDIYTLLYGKIREFSYILPEESCILPE